MMKGVRGHGIGYPSPVPIIPGGEGTRYGNSPEKILTQKVGHTALL